MVLDLDQLREVTLEDADLMRELLAALIADTELQLPLLDRAIRGTDLQRCASLAHYCKGACANVGAKAAATVLAELERSAKWAPPKNAGGNWPHSHSKSTVCAPNASSFRFAVG